MTLQKTFLIALSLPLCLALPGFAAKERMEVVTTNNMDVAAGSLIQIEGATGELNIVGWDQPTVQVVTDRYTFEDEKDKQKYTDKLKSIDAVKLTAANGKLTIATTRKRSDNIHLDYQIMVPRTSRLLIRHHIGDVVVTDVGGDIDARTGAGDIVVQLPDNEKYSIDARTLLGGVYSDFSEGKHSYLGTKLMQEASTGEAKGPAHKIDLHVDTGGISIQRRVSAPPIALTPPTAGLRQRGAGPV